MTVLRQTFGVGRQTFQVLKTWKVYGAIDFCDCEHCPCRDIEVEDMAAFAAADGKELPF